MAYHTIAYLIVFLPVTACIYQLARCDKRRYVLLLAGYYFFWTFSKMLVFFLMGTTLFTHYICVWMTRIREQNLCFATKESDKPGRKTGNSKEEKKILIFGILVLLGVLGYLKYHNFFVSNWNLIADKTVFIPSLQKKEMLIPIGISFYTLQAIGYMTDVYWNKTEVYPHPGKIALFLGFFPQIMEGPISSYAQTADQLWKGESIRLENLTAGCVRILWGLFKKMIIADRLYVLVGTIYDKPEDYKGAAIAVAAVAYTIQLYMEFSGCMDIVIGSGRVFGVQLPENFRQPFFAESASDFWRRWHITLGVWFRTYVFYPVSVSRIMKKWTKFARHRFGKNIARMGTMAMALFPVWLCNGLWHGPKWNYIFYGMYYFVILFFEAAIEPARDLFLNKCMIRKEAKWYRAVRIVKTWIIVFTGELFFRAESLGSGIKMFVSMFNGFSLRQLNRASRLHSQIDDLNKQVDHSNVAAVKKAYDEIEEHDRMAQKTMKDFQAFVKQKVRGFVDEIEERNRIIKSLQLRIKAQKCSLWFSRDLLIVYALCSLVADPTILLDLRNILVSMDLLLEEYSEWICCPCYIPYPGAEPLPYESGSAWAVRTVSIVAGVAFAAGIACLCRHVYTRIRAQWCRLAARVTVSLLIIVTTLGAVIKEHLQWNTAALSFVLFIVVMKLMHRLEVSYSHAHKTDEWERIKDHDNKSFYVTYHVYRLLSHERSWGREKEKQV